MPRAPIQRKRVCRLIEQDNRSFSEVLNHLHAIVQKHPKWGLRSDELLPSVGEERSRNRNEKRPGEHTVNPATGQKAMIIQRRWAESVRVHRSRCATEGVDG
jgi:hypothetical protein